MLTFQSFDSHLLYRALLSMFGSQPGPVHYSKLPCTVNNIKNGFSKVLRVVVVTIHVLLTVVSVKRASHYTYSVSHVHVYVCIYVYTCT